ncbi:PEP-CTERM sorting domain-containing protein [Pseudoroseomonas wenyumeiae]|uniref:PEP-CTERM sorting domain-containing protein n=1 Tax=Teichococcus wenyumeiae TaxID=2478470 RepID=A0A3A9J8M8_9PROT|nr:PEP-CTERM sorting domain-containing protein [Pseudoroseomonas wenyumeiae]RKK02400.1 PEP-CTERM sorting domain-containing protein [Pseudoroseomonas wenyumeiae]RMI15206.1 PEP-CTERM sorting domain-containing protein [Pseudoroseomonas wenyumeiae]
MLSIKGFFTAAIASAVLAVAVPQQAEAAAYFTTDAWYGAISDAAAERGSVTLTPLGGYEVSYTDWYGSWTQETKNDPFPAGPDAGWYFQPDSLLSRGVVHFANDVTPGTLAGTYSCHSPISRCVGVMSMTFTLPYEVIGLSGMLNLWADHWPTVSIFPELEVGSILKGTDWKLNDPDTFYGKMFDLPTNTFTVNWNYGQYGSDNFAGFTLTDVMLVRAPTAVPEPASAALFGFGLLSVFMARRFRKS